MQAASFVLALLLVAGSVNVNGQTPAPSSSTTGRTTPGVASSPAQAAPTSPVSSNVSTAPSPAPVVINPIAPASSVPISPLPANNVTINNINTVTPSQRVVNTVVVNNYVNNIVNIANNNQQISNVNNFINFNQVNQFAQNINIVNVDITVVNTALINLIQLYSGGGSININQFYYDLQIFALYIQKQTRATYAPVCPTVMVGNQVCFG